MKQTSYMQVFTGLLKNGVIVHSGTDLQSIYLVCVVYFLTGTVITAANIVIIWAEIELCYLFIDNMKYSKK